MVTKIIINADDYGLSRSITDNILDSFDNGILNSVSIIVNGHAFDHAISEYKKRSGIRLSIHLNFVEGKPISSPENVHLLVNKEGFFCHSFVSLWLIYIFSLKRTKKLLRSQLQVESTAQIRAVKNKFGDDFELNIDSHQHLHMLPFVFDVLVILKSASGV